MGYKSCEKSSTCKPVNAVTKSVPNSGRSSPTNTESTQPEPTMATPTFSSNESTSTTTKPPAVNTSQEPFSSIWNQVPWTLSDPDHSDKSSDQTTSSSANPVPVTTGPKVTTPKVPNWLTPFSMSSEKNLNLVIASKVSNSLTV